MFSNSQAILLSYQTRNRQEALHSSPPAPKVVSGYAERGPARVVLSLSGGTLWLLLGLRKTDEGEVARPSVSLLNFHDALYRIRYFQSNNGKRTEQLVTKSRAIFERRPIFTLISSCLPCDYI